MIISCPECETKYRYDERRFDGESVKRVKCTSCGHTFEAANPALGPARESSPFDSGFDDGAADREASWSGDRADSAATASPKAEEVRTPAPNPTDDSPLPPMPSDPRYSLAVIAGGQAGTVFQIHKSRLFLGRGSAMEIQLRDSEVSRRHAMIEIRDPDVILTDLDATNGTWFNGAKITSTRLDHQDEFTLGSTTLMLIVTPVRGSH